MKSSESSSAPRNRALWILFLLGLIGCLSVFFLVFWDRLRPRKVVVTESVLLLPSSEALAGKSPTRQTIAQASGWVEPDPYAVGVPFKTDGFVEEVLVLEGEQVRAGQILATLDDADLKANLEIAKARVLENQSRALHVDSEIKGGGASIEQAQARIAQQDVVVHLHRDRMERLERLQEGDVAAEELVKAKHDVRVAEIEADALGAALVIEQARIETYGSEKELVQAQVRASEELVALASLNLSRAVLRSPMDGKVLQRLAEPGVHSGSLEGSLAFRLYDPDLLQVRVDVPLASIGMIRTGQVAKVRTAASSSVFDGVVDRITGEADITRNTLQVKVRLIEPGEVLKPEMLCRVEFLGEGGTLEQRANQLWLPEAALLADQTSVWEVNGEDQSLIRRSVDLGDARRDGWVAVTSGIQAGARVVIRSAETLQEGDFVEEGEVQ